MSRAINPTNENSRAVVSDAGAFQIGSLTGRYPHTALQPKGKRKPFANPSC